LLSWPDCSGIVRDFVRRFCLCSAACSMAAATSSMSASA
jgi:hypothetical protein